jgi:hypothetical protein
LKAVREPSRQLVVRQLPDIPAWRASTWTVTFAIQVLTAAALVVDAYVHFVNAGLYDPAMGGFITEGNLFRAQAAAATFVAAALLLRPAIVTWMAAFLVAASAFGAVIVYRYVNVGSLGPIPNLYEPTWAPSGKLLSAYAEAAALLLAAGGLLITSSRRRTSRD